MGHKRQSGNIFFALFGAVALVGVMSGGLMVFMKGPLATSVRVTKQNVAENQMMIAAQVSVMAAASQANAGDCDADTFVEPLEWRAGGALPVPTGGGLMPNAVGANKRDPWGTEYGYCVWDHGPSTNGAGTCGGAGQLRLSGTNNAGYPVVALISAGADKTFTTTCRTFATADTNADGDLNDATDLSLVSKAASTDDDIIFAYTYEEASGAAGGLWSLKSGDPGVATIDKDIETGGDASFIGLTTNSITARTGNTIDMLDGLKLPDASTYNPTCDGTLVGVIRRNGSGLEMCSGSSWTGISGSGGGGGGDYWELTGTDISYDDGKATAAGGLAVGNETQVTTCNAGNAGLIRYNTGASTGSPVPLSIVRSATRAETSNTQASNASFSALPAAGNSIIVAIALRRQAGTPGMTSVTDNQGNTYSQVSTGTATGGTNKRNVYIYAAHNIGSPTGTFTVTVTSNATAHRAAWAAIEVAGIATSGSTDVTGATTNSGTTTTTTVSTTATTTNADDVAIGLLSLDNDATNSYLSSSGWNNVYSATAGANGATVSVVSQIVNSVGVQSHQWTHTSVAANRAVATIATFKRAAVSTSGPPALQYCNGSTWQSVSGTTSVNSAAMLVLSPVSNNAMNVIGGCGSGTCYSSPQVFTLTNVGSSASQAIAPSLTNTTNFEISSTTCSGALAAGANCTINVRAKTNGNESYTGLLQIAVNNAPFSVLQGTGSAFGCTPGAAGPGGIYVDCNVGGLYDLITTPSGCTGGTLNPTCPGTGDTDRYTMGSNDYGVVEITSTTNGPQNSVDLMAYSGGSIVFPAIAYCHNLVYGGKTDWYLPAIGEFEDSFIPNGAAIGLGFDYYDEYWTSTRAGWDASPYYYIARPGSYNTDWSADNNLYARCARREVQALPSPRIDNTPALNVDITYAPGGSTVTEGPMEVFGITEPANIAISGSGSPQFSINGGAYVTNGTVSTGDTITLRVTAPGAGTEATVTLLSSGSPFQEWTIRAVGGNTVRVFVSASDHNGGFGTWYDDNDPRNFDGVDAFCQAQATGAGLTGTWKAIVGDDTRHPRERMAWNWNRMENMAGQLVANNLEDFFDGTIVNPINRTQANVVKAGTVWTGSNDQGWGSMGCYDFTDDYVTNGGYGVWGNISATTGGDYLESDAGQCNTLNAVYCLEQPPAAGGGAGTAEGYFVLTSGSWDGNLGGKAGADAKCLADLTANNWMGKTSATSRGLLDAAHVEAFLCDGVTSCASAQGSTRYYFARSGSPTIGGSSFTTDAGGNGPGDLTAWGGTTYFGGSYSYWTNYTEYTGNDYWDPQPFYTGAASDDTCLGFTDVPGGGTPIYGSSGYSNNDRWHRTYTTCYTPQRLVCFVHPN